MNLTTRNCLWNEKNCPLKNIKKTNKNYSPNFYEDYIKDYFQTDLSKIKSKQCNKCGISINSRWFSNDVSYKIFNSVYGQHHRGWLNYYDFKNNNKSNTHKEIVKKISNIIKIKKYSEFNCPFQGNFFSYLAENYNPKNIKKLIALTEKRILLTQLADKNPKIFKKNFKLQSKINIQIKNLIQEIKKLREEQANLKNETDSAKKETKDLAKKQEKLQEKMKKVKESIKDLDKKNEELENKNSLPKTKEDEKEIENSMKKSKESLDKKDNKKSSKSQKKSLEKLDELADKLSDMQQSNSEEKQIENIETLREILENLLNLSFSQEDLINKTRKTKTSSSEFIKLVQIQKKLSDDSKIIEDSLFALSKRVVQIQEKINSEISLIKENMIESTKKLEERVIKKSTEKQQFVMTSTNNLALLLSEILKNMQLDLSKMPSKCKKPKNCNNPQKCNNPSMSELKKAQKELNEKMKKGKEKGKGKDGKGEMSSKKLMELAKKQGLIKSGLESLEKENGELGNSKMLDKIKEQMEENEYDIINNNISNKTFERLDKIIDKFIDFEKAEKEKGEDEKRESNEWMLDENKIDKKYNIVKKKQKSQLELRNTTPVNLSPFFKNEVNKYFNSIIKENND